MCLMSVTCSHAETCTFSHGVCCAGLVTDAPAVEVWLLCSEPVSLKPECLSAELIANSPLTGNTFPMFSSGSKPSNTLRWVVALAQNTSLADGLSTQPIFGIVTLDPEQGRYSLPTSTCPAESTDNPDCLIDRCLFLQRFAWIKARRTHGMFGVDHTM